MREKMLKFRPSSEANLTIKETTFFRTLFLVTIMMTLAMIFILSLLQGGDENVPTQSQAGDITDKSSSYRERYSDEEPGEFLFDSESCRIPNLNPFSIEAMSVFKAVKPEICGDNPPLTSIERGSDGNITLKIHWNLKASYASGFRKEISCCYQRISRISENESFLSKECMKFVSGHRLDEKDEFILVTCKKYINIFFFRLFKSEVYKNAHAIINKKQNVTQKLQRKSGKVNDKTNVLFIGIDSISRLHLTRAMPTTYDYLRQKQWLEMRAYNKIDDNTFPNFMAILAGVNQSHAFAKCSTKEMGGINKCRFLWDDFSDANYVTAYAEDSMEITTFNFYKKGFSKQPTDYYFRPLALVAEKHLKTTHDKPWNTNCVGYKHYADYIYEYAADFADKYRDESYFGLFWTNSFSHDDLNLPSGYDLRMRNHLKSLEERKLLDNTIVIFFSDHGMRFGEIRKFFTGWLEERLPFLFLWIPERFKQRHPELTRNLETNANRLTTPYDIYITVKHILQLSSDQHEESLELTAISCPTCQSLLHEVPINRTCADAAIPENYCTCSPYKKINHTLPVIGKIAGFIVDVLNAQLSPHKKCAKLELKEVISARELTYNHHSDYLVTISVSPSKAEFEATVRSTSDVSSFELLGDISRINRYGNQSRCIRDSHLRKYCYCV